MALIVSAASGNFNVGATWVGGVVPTIGDEAQAANGHTITITANANCDLVSNTGTGIFTLNGGVTLTANVTNKSTTASRNCVQFLATAPAIAEIAGNITGGSVNGAVGILVSSTGRLNVTGNITGGSGASAYGLSQPSNSDIYITGNIMGGSGNNAWGITTSNTTANVIVTGNVTGGTNTGATGFYHWGTGTAIITGIATGGTLGGTTGGGLHNNIGGLVTIKRIVGNAFGPGNAAGLTSTPGANNQSSGIIEFEELEYGTFGQSPTSGSGFRFKKVSSNKASFNYVDSGVSKILVDATTGQMPAISNVRLGVSYASGALTGTCAVPAANSVAFGVPVDNTTGTALLTGAAVATAVWGAATRSITGGTVDTLTNPPTVPTVVQIRQEMDSNSTKLANLDTTISSRLSPSGTLATVTTLTNAPTVPSAAAIASQVRSELSVELGRVDQSISSRLAGSAYTAPANSDITAIKDKTDLLNTDRLAQVSTVSTTGAQLAAALS